VTTTTTTTTTVPPVPPGALAASVFDRHLIISGSAGDDTITVTKVGKSRYAVDTHGAAITLGTGCTFDGTFPKCGGSDVQILGKAGNDHLTVVGSVHSTIDAGDGNDVMIGGTSADTFIGGPGFDTVDYTNRTGQLIVGTPGTGSDDGAKREHDNIEADVEQVLLP
jgi:Ca2+-binding RTX toxin-like protein